MLFRRRGDYTELMDELETAPFQEEQTTYESALSQEPSQQLNGFISGSAMAMKDITLQLENSNARNNAKPTLGESKSVWWKPPRWSSKKSDDASTTARDTTRIGISERPRREQQFRPLVRSKTPKRVTSSSRRPRSFHRGDKLMKSSLGAAAMLTIDENEVFDIRRHSC